MCIVLSVHSEFLWEQWGMLGGSAHQEARRLALADANDRFCALYVLI